MSQNETDLVPFDSGIAELLLAARLLLDGDYMIPGVVLLYCTVDTCAWLGLPNSQEDVRGADFIDWVRRYSLEARIAPCTAEDLYGARCGLVHSYTAGSRSSRVGRAKQVLYMRGFGHRNMLQREIDERGADAVALHVGDLFQGLKDAFLTYRTAVSSDPELRQRVVARSQNFLRPKLPDEYVGHFQSVRSWTGGGDLFQGP